jgi:hypothetical protein
MKIVIVVHLLSQDKLVVVGHLFPAPMSSSSIFSGDGLLSRTSSSSIVVLQELMRGRREEKEREEKQ